MSYLNFYRSTIIRIILGIFITSVLGIGLSTTYGGMKSSDDPLLPKDDPLLPKDDPLLSNGDPLLSKGTILSYALRERIIKYFIDKGKLNTLYVDIQGITANIDKTYTDKSINYFNTIAPSSIAKYLINTVGQNGRVVILWQGDKDHHKDKPYPPTAIGAVISTLNNILIHNKIDTHIICIANIEKECNNIQTRLKVLENTISEETINNSYDVLSESLLPDSSDEWRDELIRYYGEDIVHWRSWTKDERIGNLIKQYISNLTTDKTFILDYGFKEDGKKGKTDSISPHYNEVKFELGNVIYI